MKIEHEIQQTTFKNEYLKAHLNILFTATWMNQLTSESLKPYKLSWQQYNILRILKGKHPQPATVKELTSRMIDRMSNASRLVEKLQKKKLVKRVTNKTDRRRADIYITDHGLQLLTNLSGILEQKMVESMQGITLAEAEQLNALLDKMRD